VATNKPAVVQTAVVLKAMNGDSKRQIAEDLGIGRDTVTAILEQPELDQLIKEGKTRLHQLIPKSLNAFEHALDKHKTAEATVILQATGVLPSTDQSSGAAVNINFGALPRRNECQKST
jgi:hypothetical protein